MSRDNAQPSSWGELIRQYETNKCQTPVYVPQTRIKRNNGSFNPILGAYSRSEDEQQCKLEETRAQNKLLVKKQTLKSFTERTSNDFDIISNNKLGPRSLDVEPMWRSSNNKVIPNRKNDQHSRNAAMGNSESIPSDDNLSFLDRFPSLRKDRENSQTQADQTKSRKPRMHWTLTGEPSPLHAGGASQFLFDSQTSKFGRVLPRPGDSELQEEKDQATRQRVKEYFRNTCALDPVRGTFVDEQIEEAFQKERERAEREHGLGFAQKQSKCVLNSEGEAYDIVSCEPKQKFLADCYEAIDARALHHPVMRAVNIARLRESHRRHWEKNTNADMQSDLEKDKIYREGGSGFAPLPDIPPFPVRSGPGAHAIELALRERADAERQIKEDRAVNRRAPRQSQGPSQRYDILTNIDYTWVPNPARQPLSAPVSFTDNTPYSKASIGNSIDKDHNKQKQPKVSNMSNNPDDALEHIRSLLVARGDKPSTSAEIPPSNVVHGNLSRRKWGDMS